MIEWLKDPTNSDLVGSLVTTLVALIASITTLLVAFLAYPWQKRKDREFETHRERRDAYRSLLGTMNRFFTAIIERDAEQATKQQFELHRVASDFLCYASKDCAVASRSYIKAVQTYRRIVFDQKPNANAKPELHAEWTKYSESARARCVVERKNTIASFRVDLTDVRKKNAVSVVEAHFSEDA